MYAFAKEVTGKAEECRKLYEESKRKRTLVHGDYNYHNLIMTSEGIATVNFDNFRIDIQAGDLYYFMRKIMEKNHWDRHLGEQIIRSYTRIHPLSGEEMEYLALRLAYPEKFLKQPIHIISQIKQGFHRKVSENWYFLSRKQRRKSGF